MSNNKKDLKRVKSCFGQYENWDNSWHCKGCLLSDECKEHTEEISVEEGEDECEACKIQCK